MSGLFNSLIGPSVDLIFSLDHEDKRKKFQFTNKPSYSTPTAASSSIPIFSDGESVTGKVTIRIKDAKKIEHAGIRIEFLGIIKLSNEKPLEFINLTHELASAGKLNGEIKHICRYDFDFKNVEKPFESYAGNQAKLSYVLRITISRRMADIVKEKPLWVINPNSGSSMISPEHSPLPGSNGNIKMEVGIEDCLHIEFEYNRNKYHLNDVVVGKIYFILVRIKIKYMELAILRRETLGSSLLGGSNTINDNETIGKFEIMDGSPSKGEVIPLRIFLKSLSDLLTPTYKDVNKKFSVRYYLNLVLIDEENRRYFKQQEIILYRD